MSIQPVLIVIVGPTASGKSNLAIKLARKFNGEIVSADSRQVFSGMDIGTGKVSKAEQRLARHYLLDIANPRKEYTIAHFQRDAQVAIQNIAKRGRLPFLVGGTAFWIDAVANGYHFPHVKPNKALRKKLSKLSTDTLLSMLKKLDPRRAKSIDKRNPYRLIRAIEIIRATKKPVQKIARESPYRLLWLGISVPQNKLRTNIHRRLLARMKQGMVAEVKRLLQNGVPARRLLSIGLEYRFITLYLQGKLTKQEMLAKIEFAIRHYAKRQMTWWKRNLDIHWVRSYREARTLLNKYTT